MSSQKRPTVNEIIKGQMSTMLMVVIIICAGCVDSRPTATVDQEESQPSDPPAAARVQSTDDIEEFKPEDGREIVSSKVQITNPITGPLEAYDPLKQKIAEDIQIQHAVRLFQATEGRYPKDFDEFMEKIIKANRIKLPPLSSDKQYQYDVANHKLVVVRVTSE